MADTNKVEKKEKKEKKAKEGKKGFFGAIAGFFRDIKSELKKIQWPSFKIVRNNTGVVLAAIILVGAFVAVLDLIFSQARNLFLG